MSFDKLFSEIRSSCTDEEWSEAVALSRQATFVKESEADGEISILISLDSRAAAVRVILWPDAEDWNCEARDDETLVMSAAAAISYKHGKIRTDLTGSADSKVASIAGLLRYEFVPVTERSFQNGLELRRYVVGSNSEALLPGSLTNYIGGVTAGRIKGKVPVVSQSDYAVDRVLDRYRNGPLPREIALRLLRELKSIRYLFFQGQPLHVSIEKPRLQIRVSEDEGGYLLGLVGANIYGLSGLVIQNACLYPLGVDTQNLLLEFFSDSAPRVIRRDCLTQFVSEVLPRIEKCFEIVGDRFVLPKFVDLEPYLVFDIVSNPGALTVLPKIVYGEPIVAEVGDRGLNIIAGCDIPTRRLDLEQRLKKRALTDYAMLINRSRSFVGVEIPEMLSLLQNEKLIGHVDQLGRALELKPEIYADERQFSLSFVTQGLSRKVSFEELNQAILAGSKFVELGGGLFGEIPREWFFQHGARAEQILEALGANGKPPRAKLPQIAEFCSDIGVSCSDGLLRLREQLVELKELPPFSRPFDLQADLRDYQASGARWLQCLKNWELGALLADDMGLGKTLQALSIITGRTLVVAPTSVIHTWQEQAARFRPGLRVSLFWGANRQFDQDADLLITSYGVLRQEREQFCKEVWDLVIVDESQAIKNPDSLTAQAVFSLSAKFRMAITGTPLENSLTDLWSQFNFILPGFLPELHKLQNADVDTQWDIKSLRKMIRPYLLRRKKEEVARELPSKTEEIIFCELSKEERDLYQTLLVALRQEVKNQTGSQSVSYQNPSSEGQLSSPRGSTFAIFEALLRLRQACCHSALVPGSDLDVSTKLDTLEAMLVSAVAEGHRAIVFSQWTSLLDRIEPRLQRSAIAYLRLDGSTTNRREIVEDFQRPDGPAVLIMSLKAGGVGLTLTAADYVFFCDPWWNPAAEAQAEDRAHRIGQDKPVFVYRLVTKDTIEERVLTLQAQKRALAEGVLDGEEVGLALSREDLLEILS